MKTAIRRGVARDPDVARDLALWYPESMAESSPQVSCTGPEVVIPGSIRLYRSWTYERLPATRPKWYSLSPRENAVISGLHGQTWDSATLTADCLPSKRHYGAEYTTAGHTSDNATPAVGCKCGIYGYYRRHSIMNLTVKGTVRASGKLLMGTHGARAAYAEIESLYVGDAQLSDRAGYMVTLRPEDFKPMAKALRRRYPGVPVYTDPLEWVLAYPSEDVSTLLGE